MSKSSKSRRRSSRLEDLRERRGSFQSLLEARSIGSSTPAVEATKSCNFFQSLAPFRSFECLLDESNYVRAPNDWYVVMTDVKGSTKAIEEGHYHDVNIIGAASIAVLQTAMDDEPLPFAFGGDGASALVPEYRLSAAKRELKSLRRMARENFNLDLRVGLVSVETLEQEGHVVWVAKYQLRHGYPLAVFRGDALVKAEEMMKADGRFLIEIDDADCEAMESDLSKLFCFWRPIKTSRGKIMSLLITAKTDKPDHVYHIILLKLASIIDGGSLYNADPININAMEMHSVNHLFSHGRKFSISLLPFLIRIMAALFMWVLCGSLTRFHKSYPKLKTYLQDFHSDSDFCKFAQSLSMVLDCTASEIEAIEKLCQSLFLEGKIDYGIYYSADSLMTCYVPNPENGGHVAFVDGGDGGYAMAAKQLKNRRRSNIV